MGLQNRLSETYFWTAYFFPLPGKANQDDYFSLSRLCVKYFKLGEINSTFLDSAYKHSSK